MTRPSEEDVRKILKSTLAYSSLNLRVAVFGMFGPNIRQRAEAERDAWLEREVSQIMLTCWTCPDSAHPVDEMCPYLKENSP